MFPIPPSDLSTLCSLLRSLTAARSLPTALQLHAHVLKSGASSSSPLVTNHLINLYSKCGLPDSSILAFHDFPTSLPRPRSSWSSLLSSLAANSLVDLALRYFLLMLRAGVLPDDRSLPLAAKSCGALSDDRLGGSLQALATKTGLDSDVFVGSSLVDMYAKCGRISEARVLFDEMPERNVVTWSAMVCGYAQMGRDDEALVLFKMALEAAGTEVDSCMVNDFTYSGVLRVCSESTLLEPGRQIHARCAKTSFDASPFVGSSLISVYSKCGVMDDAYRVFDEVPVRNLGIWNAMLAACAQHGHTLNAFECFQQMEASGTCPNFITFLCLLYACSHAGLVNDGKRYFELMVARGIEAGPQHYASMVDLLGRAGELQEAVDFISRMTIPPPDSVWTALLTGCRIHKDATTTAYAAARLRECGSRSSGAHVLLCNAYAAAGDYAQAAKARKAMRDNGIKKETGLSWVELGNQIHAFVSGDWSHPRSEEIYRKLEEVGVEMGRAGYVPDTAFVLRDVDGEEKRRAVGSHSERLAVALGMLMLPERERVVRVMKNLRVCGDCHAWFKFLTRCTGRTVVVRDNTRFHRFEGGVCSCRDYW